MGDVGEYWKDHRDWKRSEDGQKYHDNRRDQAITDINNIPEIKIIAIHNNDEQYVLEIDTVFGIAVVDFYPSTLLWKKRKGKASGQSVGSMVKYFKIGSRKELK